MSLKYNKFSQLIIELSFKVKYKKFFSKCIWLLNNARSTVCPTHWAAVVLVLVLIGSSKRLFFIWKIEGADLHQVIILFLICVLYIMHTMYFTISSNLLSAEHRCSCFLVVFSKKKRGKRRRIHICNHTLLTFTCWV